MFNKKLIIILGILLLFILLYSNGVRECVSNRAEVGIPSDWATIKDCSY